ncbi:hypothetical protein BE17_27280 [Sorangium cellulosum]|uniref:HNH nuclease domain-containing protein n=1 Tax=Sorangium cellulosum TaxID=56 RepID=A0A150S7U6_SORCE|nr:hypothetical protein BE17_27280 [Sorangium cellulosum]
MIHVPLQPEPARFDALVRQPGRRALAANVEHLPPYWRECLDDLRDGYRGICAYLCVLVPRGTGARSVDHVAPKSKRRELAYEWSNYRFVCSLMNARKRDFDDVLDPMEIPDGWFVLELSFLQVLPAEGLHDEARACVQATIERLKLNDKECIAAREMYYTAYLDKGLTLELLQEWSPFVAREVVRQGLARRE